MYSEIQLHRAYMDGLELQAVFDGGNIGFSPHQGTYPDCSV